MLHWTIFPLITARYRLKKEHSEARMPRYFYFMNLLGEKIKNLRLQKGWTQLDAASKCGVSQSVLSRIEGGDITTPTADTVEKLAHGFGISNDSLSLLVTTNVQNGPSELRVGFAHSLWAAPVIPLAMEGPTPTGIALTSYGSHTPTEFDYKPEWYDSKQKNLIRVGPRLNNAQRANGPLPSGYNLWPDEAEAQLTTYSAADLDQLLKQGEIDCVVAAKNVFDSYDKLLIRCARILDCIGSGTALLVWDPQWEWATDFAVTETSLLDLSELLKQAAKGKNRKLRLFYPEGTNAEKSLDFLPQELFVDPNPIPLKRWESVARTLKTALREEHAFLFLCWEPFLSYARALFDDPVQSVTAVHLSDRKPIPYLAFDLFFTREKAKDWFASKNVRHFLSRVAHNIDKIKEAIRKQDKDARVVSQISSYLGMSASDCLLSLSEMDFDLLYYPDWLELSTWTQR